MEKINGYWYYFAPEDMYVDDLYEGPVLYDQGRMFDGGAMPVNGKYYFFGLPTSSSKWGKLQYGWCYDDTNGYWYYADSNNDGVLTTGWKKISGKWYYFEKDWLGEMVCNITHTVGGKLYTFDRNGALREKAGWIDLYEYGEQDEKTSFWVYCDANGIATVGWKKISGIWYHFDEDGYMTADDWAKDSVGWMYMDKNGKALTNTWLQDFGSNQWYYLKSNGYMAANEWAKDSAGWMYMDKNGRITKSKWVKSGGKWYYLKSNGYMACSQTLTIEGKTYRFGSDGAML